MEQRPSQAPVDATAVFSRCAASYRRGIASFTATTVEVLLQGVHLSVGDRLVDLGTGTGVVAHFAQELGARVIGLDSAHGMLAQARRHVPQATWVRADGTRIPLADASADVITSAYAYACIAPGGHLSAEILRVLRPGGWVGFSNWIPTQCMNVQILARAVEAKGDPNAPVPPAYPSWLFPPEEGYRDVVSSAGLAAGRIELRSMVWRMASPYELFDSLLEINPRLHGHSPRHLPQIREETARLASAYRHGAQIEIPMGIAYGWARRAAD